MEIHCGAKPTLISGLKHVCHNHVFSTVRFFDKCSRREDKTILRSQNASPIAFPRFQWIESRTAGRVIHLDRKTTTILYQFVCVFCTDNYGILETVWLLAKIEYSLISYVMRSLIILTKRVIQVFIFVLKTNRAERYVLLDLDKDIT